MSCDTAQEAGSSCIQLVTPTHTHSPLRQPRPPQGKSLACPQDWRRRSCWWRPPGGNWRLGGTWHHWWRWRCCCRGRSHWHSGWRARHRGCHNLRHSGTHLLAGPWRWRSGWLSYGSANCRYAVAMSGDIVLVLHCYHLQWPAATSSTNRPEQVPVYTPVGGPKHARDHLVHKLHLRTRHTPPLSAHPRHSHTSYARAHSVAGWCSKGADEELVEPWRKDSSGMPYWAQQVPYGEQYALVWEPKELKDLGHALESMAIDTARDVVVSASKTTRVLVARKPTLTDECHHRPSRHHAGGRVP